MGKKREKWKLLKKRECREGHTSAHPKEGDQPGNFQKIRAERRKE